MKDDRKVEDKLLNDVNTFGWHVINVMEDEEGPGFTYSVGLYKTFGHPEIIIIGLKPDLSHAVINHIGDDIKSRKKYESGRFYSGLIESHDCYFISVDRSYYNNHIEYAKWFYKGEDFPLLQCVYPTTKGIYPWQKEWPQSIANLQPILSESNVIFP